MRRPTPTRRNQTIDYSRETTEQKEDQIEQRAGATPTLAWAKHSREVECTMSPFSLLPVMTTRAPSLANNVATALPMPELEPKSNRVLLW
uniref:Uncharacterized protein n=1 Tax=Heterorhabditis bacteriophora TaxID=37862 RepID=A0A1I7WVB0_HETBA